MSSLFQRKPKPRARPFVRGEGIAYILRTLALMSIIAGCLVAYWYNFESRFAELEELAAFATVSSLMTDEQKKDIIKLSQDFEKKWGIGVLMSVNSKQMLAPSLQPGTLFIGFVPKKGQALLLVPPLLKKAIPEESLRFLRTELDMCAIDTAPDVCLTQVIMKLDTLLQE